MIQSHVRGVAPEARPPKIKPLSKRQQRTRALAAKWSSADRRPLQDDSLYTLAEIAIFCSVSDETIRRAIENGHLKANPIGADPRLWGKNVRAWIDAGGKTGASKATKGA